MVDWVDGFPVVGMTALNDGGTGHTYFAHCGTDTDPLKAVDEKEIEMVSLDEIVVVLLTKT